MLLLEGSFAINIADGTPFGPFKENEVIRLLATVKNISTDQSISICEGICLGDEFTYSLGGFANTPNGYLATFGNGGDTSEGWLNGQIAGTLLPGQTKEFVFRTYTPTELVEPGFYSFGAQLQIFAATEERPRLSSPSIGGKWEVIPVNEPASVALLFAALLILVFARVRRPVMCASNSCAGVSS